MLKWEKTGRTVYGDGSSTVTYEAEGKVTQYRVESRKRAIEHVCPHTKGVGYWTHTSYFLIIGGKEREFGRLKDAKYAAEKMEGDHEREEVHR